MVPRQPADTADCYLAARDLLVQVRRDAVHRSLVGHGTPAARSRDRRTNDGDTRSRERRLRGRTSGCGGVEATAVKARRQLRFANCEEVMAEVGRLRSTGYTRLGRLDLAQICTHL